jgi:hypothetical protein
VTGLPQHAQLTNTSQVDMCVAVQLTFATAMRHAVAPLQLALPMDINPVVMCVAHLWGTVMWLRPALDQAWLVLQMQSILLAMCAALQMVDAMCRRLVMGPPQHVQLIPIGLVGLFVTLPWAIVI